MTQFLWPVRVYYEDTDGAGVVYYANYLRFMERARTEWLRHLGFEQDELAASDNVLFAVRRAEVDYLRPARFNDALEVRSAIAERGRASLTFHQQITKPGKEGELLCSGRIRVACVDATSFRPRPLPTPLYSQLQELKTRVG